MSETTRYVEAVRAQLADVPQPEREELLDDLEQHLAEVAADAEGPLEERLGSPEEYAAELRASARLGQPPEPWRPAAAAARIAARFQAAREHQRVRVAAAFARELRPAWWLARGAVVIAAYGVISYGPALGFPFPRLVGSRLLGLLVMMAAAAGSVWVARRRSRAMGVLNVALSVAGVIATMYYVAVLNNATAHDPFAHPTATETFGGTPFEPGDEALQMTDGRAITNIYAYDQMGRPLENVRLYDQKGKPIDIAVERTGLGRRIVTSYPLDAESRPVTNAFPQRQAIRGRPDASTAPAITVPPLAQSTPAPDPSPAEAQGGQGERARAGD